MLTIYLIVFIFGAAIGSFVNVVAVRYGSGQSFIKGRSACPSCGKILKWHELIPIFSYLILKGRCSSCHSRFSIIFCLLTIIFIYDLHHKIIPDVFVVLFIIFSFLYSFFVLHFTLYDMLFPAILIPLSFALIWLFSRGRLMGLGDAKFMVGMGLLLGLAGGISAVFLSFWLGAVFALILFLHKKIFNRGYNIGMKSEIPFAPFLVVGTLVTFIFNINLLNP